MIRGGRDQLGQWSLHVEIEDHSYRLSQSLGTLLVAHQ